MGISLWGSVFLGQGAARVSQDWISRYSPGGYSYYGGYGYYPPVNGIAVDSSGSIYITGSSAGGTSYDPDYRTIKYDTNGNQLWIARYSVAENSYDEAVAIAVDSEGNAYVTGYSGYYGWPSSNFDYVTIKYEGNTGKQLWVARYNGPGNGEDKPYAIAVDKNGNVYVTGYSTDSGTALDYATVKYDTNGKELWVARYNGPGNAIDHAYALTLDSNGNVYVTGYSFDSATQNDYATVKYDSGSGAQLWVARYNGPGNQKDEAAVISVDPSGSYVYVTGKSFGSGTDYDYATVKYDTATGNQLWVARYDSPGNYEDIASDMAVDSNGYIYITGTSGGDYATIKYDPTSGAELWVARYNGLLNDLDQAYALALDSKGDVYVTGASKSTRKYYGYPSYSYSYPYYDYATIKYDSTSGKQLWVARYNSPGDYDDYAWAIAIDSQGNIYVTGKGSNDSGSPEYVTIKYSTPSTRYVGTWRLGTIDNLGDVGTYTSMAKDSLGNLHISYQDYSNNDLKYAYYDGRRWYIQEVDTTGDVGYFSSLAVTSQNQPIIAYADNTNKGLKLARYDSTKWVIETVYPSSGGVGELALALDSNDQPHIAFLDYVTKELKHIYYKVDRWSPVEVVDSSVGGHTDIVLDKQRRPYISYYEGTNKDLKFAYYDGNDWQRMTVDASGDVGWFTSMALDGNGYPHISYYDASNKDLKYAYYDGSQWRLEVVDSQGDVGWYTAIALDRKSQPHISYLDYSNYSFKYAKKATSWQLETVDSAPYVGWYPSIILDRNDQPYIIYADAGTTSLRDATKAAIESHINSTSFSLGDTLTWDITLEGIEDYADIYLAIVLPSLDFICLRDLEGKTGPLNKAVPLAIDILKSPGIYRVFSYSFTGTEPKGLYQLYLILLKPGAAPTDIKNRIGYAHSSFTYR